LKIYEQQISQCHTVRPASFRDDVATLSAVLETVTTSRDTCNMPLVYKCLPTPNECMNMTQPQLLLLVSTQFGAGSLSYLGKDLYLVSKHNM